MGVIEGVWSASGEVGGVALGDQAAESEGVEGGYCEEMDGTDIALQSGSVGEWVHAMTRSHTA
jgi:hypothetical protein